MAITLNGTTGITSGGGYTGDGISFADGTPANTLVTTTGGNVGIGTSSPGGKLHIGGTAAGTAQAILTNGVSDPNFQLHVVNGASGIGADTIQGYLGLAYAGVGYGPQISFRRGSSTVNGSLTFDMQGNERARIDSSGNVVIGDTATTFKFDVNGIVRFRGETNFFGSGDRFVIIPEAAGSGATLLTVNGANSAYATQKYNASQHIFKVYNTEYMRVADSGGTTLVSITGQNAAGANVALDFICPGVNSGRILYERSTARLYAYSQANGVFLSALATSWTANSDERLKDIIEPINNAAEKVSSLRAVIGKYKTDEDGMRRSFLLAQDVQKVLPEAVDVNNDEIGTLGVRYTDLIPLLAAAIKEQQAMINELRNEIAALKGS